MARRHDDGSDDDEVADDQSASGKPTLLRRRALLTGLGAGAFAGMTGFTGRSRAAEVDLGAQGLKSGDNIDSYIAEHWTNGSTVYVPAGTYQTNMGWFDADVTDATLRGDPAGVKLQRAGETPTWDSGETMNPTLAFDGHVVVENITLDFALGQPKEKFDVEGGSSNAHLELRNVNLPKGSLGCGDSQFGRARGDGRVTYKWCYIGPTANATFYQTSSASSSGSIRQVFDGCVMVNMKDCWRGGTRDYTIRNCLYWADEPAPSWSDNGGGDGTSSECWSSNHNPFKFDQDFSFQGTIENLHLVFKSGCGGIEHVFDFQGDQPDTSGTAGPIYLYNDEGSTNFEGGGSAGGWTFGPVHLSGQYSSASDYGVSSGDVEFVENGDGALRKLPAVWTPGGKGMPLADGKGSTGSGGGGSANQQPDDQTDEQTNEQADGQTETPDDQQGTPADEEADASASDAGASVFEIVSTTEDADLDYTFDVEGSVEPAETESGVSAVGERNVDVADGGDGTTTVTGRTGRGFGDAFRVGGTVTSFARTGGRSDVLLRLDGEDVTDELVSGS